MRVCLVMYTTQSWYGLNELNNSDLWHNFENRLDKYTFAYYGKVVTTLNGKPVHDLMYVLVKDDEFFTNIKRHLFILAIAKILITKYGYLSFHVWNICIFILIKLHRLCATCVQKFMPILLTISLYCVVCLWGFY